MRSDQNLCRRYLSELIGIFGMSSTEIRSKFIGSLCLSWVTSSHELKISLRIVMDGDN